MSFRVSKLKNKGIVFSYKDLNKGILWDNESVYESGIVFSGKNTKGQALQYFLEKLAHWKPQHIIFIDDNPEYLKAVKEMCNNISVKFTGFYYKAAVFDQDPELSREVVRLQIKTLDKQELWIPDSEAKKIVEEGKK